MTSRSHTHVRDHMRSLLRWLFGRERITVSRVKDKRVSCDAARFDTHLKLATEMGKPFPLRLRYDAKERVTIAGPEAS